MSNLDRSAERAAVSELCPSSQDCVKVLSRDGVIRHLNEDGLKLLEIDSFDQVKGTFWPDLWPDDSRALVTQALDTVREAGVASFSAPCPTARGTAKWWHVTVAAMPGDKGDIVAISRDITDELQETSKRDLERQRLTSIFRSTPDVLWDST